MLSFQSAPCSNAQVHQSTCQAESGTPELFAGKAWAADLAQIGRYKLILALSVWDEFLEGKINERWIDLVGGLSLSRVKTEIELLIAAEIAPNDLLFGLAYGKFVDLLARPEQHGIALVYGNLSPIHNALSWMVLSQGQNFAQRTGLNDFRFARNMVSCGSHEDVGLLYSQALSAPDAFSIGQLTSWFLTAEAAMRRQVPVGQ